MSKNILGLNRIENIEFPRSILNLVQKETQELNTNKSTQYYLRKNLRNKHFFIVSFL